jgi:parallel beta-helix repeat protein
MSRKLVLILVLLILLPFLVYVTLLYVRFNPTEKVPSGGPVHNINTGLNYTTIQTAIDANETLDGHTIFVEEGVYYERVIVKKAVLLIGENRSTTIIDGKGRDMGVNVADKRITIKELTVRNCTTGIYLKNSNNSLVIENTVIFNDNAILVYGSVNCTFHQNILGNNTERGILVTNSRNFTVSNNRVYGNGISLYSGYGLNANFSANGLIKQNYAYENDYDGIGLFDSSNCTVVENNVEKNRFYGILLSTSPNNLVYHNNLINNTFFQAADSDPTNRWDDGVEGNYWSNYGWFDLNHDGIGDTAQAVGGNQDNKPLMGQFHSFNASMSYNVNIISNSTITDFKFFDSNKTLRIYVSNSSVTQSFGFCRVNIPKALMTPPHTVTIDNGSTAVLNFNGTLYDNGTHRCIYFAYQHSTRKVDIVGASP